MRDGHSARSYFASETPDDAVWRFQGRARMGPGVEGRSSMVSDIASLIPAQVRNSTSNSAFFVLCRSCTTRPHL